MIPPAEMTALEETVLEIAALVENQCERVSRALDTRDLTHLAEVKQVEGEINARHARVETLTFRLIALYQPVARDLRKILMTLRTSIDTERIGDYFASNSRILRKALTVMPDDMVEAAARLMRSACSMAMDVFAAWRDEDAVKAVEVWNRDEEVNNLYHDFILLMQACPQKYGLDTEICRRLYFFAKNCERLGDHATNIAEHIYFQVYGSPMNLEDRDDAWEELGQP